MKLSESTVNNHRSGFAILDPRILASSNEPPMSSTRFQALAAAAIALTATVAGSAEPTNITAGELALTPAFCQDVQTINGWSQHGRESPRSPMWIEKMGKTFWGMHHYCWGMVNIHRSQAAGQSPQERTFKIHSAINDYYYVVRIAPPDFVLLPEVFYLIGEAHGMVNEHVNAIEAYQKALQIKPDYWPPYEGHARILEKLGKKAEARAVLEKGLQVAPNEPRLKALYERLGHELAKGGLPNAARGATSKPPSSAPTHVPQ